jgi:hypothetical protein
MRNGRWVGEEWNLQIECGVIKECGILENCEG